MDESKPMVDQVNIVVSDVAATADFLGLLGVDVDTTAPEWMAHHRTITSTSDGISADIDSNAFGRSYWDQGMPSGWTGVIVGLRVPSRDAVDSIYARATAAGYAGRQAPFDAFWGARYAVVEGPDGIVVGLMSERDDTTATAPPNTADFNR